MPLLIRWAIFQPRGLQQRPPSSVLLVVIVITYRRDGKSDKPKMDEAIMSTTYGEPPNGKGQRIQHLYQRCKDLTDQQEQKTQSVIALREI